MWTMWCNRMHLIPPGLPDRVKSPLPHLCCCTAAVATPHPPPHLLYQSQTRSSFAASPWHKNASSSPSLVSRGPSPHACLSSVIAIYAPLVLPLRHTIATQCYHPPHTSCPQMNILAARLFPVCRSGWRVSDGDEDMETLAHAHTLTETHTLKARENLCTLYTKALFVFLIVPFLLNLTVTLICKKLDLWNEFTVQWRDFFFLKSLFNIR